MTVTIILPVNDSSQKPKLAYERFCTRPTRVEFGAERTTNGIIYHFSKSTIPSKSRLLFSEVYSLLYFLKSYSTFWFGGHPIVQISESHSTSFTHLPIFDTRRSTYFRVNFPTYLIKKTGPYSTFNVFPRKRPESDA